MTDNIIHFPGNSNFGAHLAPELDFERRVQRNFSEAAQEMRRSELAQKLAEHGVPNLVELRDAHVATTDTKPLQ